MQTVKLGIVGIGSMGAIHAQNVLDGNVARCQLTALCDPKPERHSLFSSAEGFLSVDDFFRSSQTDAVLIATPHYSHTSIGIRYHTIHSRGRALCNGPSGERRQMYYHGGDDKDRSGQLFPSKVLHRHTP